jgi:hypothetical protein
MQNPRIILAGIFFAPVFMTLLWCAPMLRARAAHDFLGDMALLLYLF